MATDVETREQRDAARATVRRVMQTPGEVDWQDVSSSTLQRITYSKSNNMLLAQFVGGKVYAYFDVPESKYSEFLAAGSAGRFLNLEIKPFYTNLAI